MITRWLLEESLLLVEAHGSRRIVHCPNPEALLRYLKNRLKIDLKMHVQNLLDGNLSRADGAKAGANSKLYGARSLTGFLVNVLAPITATLDGIPWTIEPQCGRCPFVHSFLQFTLPEDVTVVGVENAESFFQIQAQRYLFENITPIFVLRFANSSDIVRWLQRIPNDYVHFGDFDFSGMRLYLSEFKQKLGTRARFLVPSAVEALLHSHGNRNLYDIQRQYRPGLEMLNEPDMQQLLKWIDDAQAGLEQEIFITHRSQD